MTLGPLIRCSEWYEVQSISSVHIPYDEVYLALPTSCFSNLSAQVPTPVVINKWLSYKSSIFVSSYKVKIVTERPASAGGSGHAQEPTPTSASHVTLSIGDGPSRGAAQLNLDEKHSEGKAAAEGGETDDLIHRIDIALATQENAQ